jgi:hypothetical protein
VGRAKTGRVDTEGEEGNEERRRRGQRMML